MTKADEILKIIQEKINYELEIYEHKREQAKSGVSKCMKDMYCGGLIRALIIIAEEKYKFLEAERK